MPCHSVYPCWASSHKDHYTVAFLQISAEDIIKRVIAFKAEHSTRTPKLIKDTQSYEYKLARNAKRKLTAVEVTQEQKDLLLELGIEVSVHVSCLMPICLIVTT